MLSSAIYILATVLFVNTIISNNLKMLVILVGKTNSVDNCSGQQQSNYSPVLGLGLGLVVVTIIIFRKVSEGFGSWHMSHILRSDERKVLRVLNARPLEHDIIASSDIHSTPIPTSYNDSDLARQRSGLLAIVRRSRFPLTLRLPLHYTTLNYTRLDFTTVLH